MGDAHIHIESGHEETSVYRQKLWNVCVGGLGWGGGDGDVFLASRSMCESPPNASTQGILFATIMLLLTNRLQDLFLQLHDTSAPANRTAHHSPQSGLLPLCD